MGTMEAPLLLDQFLDGAGGWAGGNEATLSALFESRGAAGGERVGRWMGYLWEAEMEG